MAELVLGLDIGTASSKAVLAEPDGTLIARAQVRHRVSRPQTGWAEHDAEAVWWHDVRVLCDELLDPDRRARLAGICVSGIGPCVVPCDAALRPLRPAILYGIDARAEAEIADLETRFGAERILRRGGSALSSQAIGPKLLWLQRHEPAVWGGTAGWYMASSFVVARLTGEYVLDHHSASQCDPMYDLAVSGWADDWATELSDGVPLPRLVWPAEVVGTVTASGAHDSGLPAGTPVIAGTIDAWAEALSVGVRRPGDMMVMYGSTMFVVGVCDGPLVHPKLWATAGVEPGTACLAAGMATSGAVIDWLCDLLGSVPVEELLAAAEGTPPGADGLVMLPYLAGERSPLFDPHARGVVAGLTLSHGRGHLARAVYEGTAFGLRHNLETIEDAGWSARRVVAVGGGTGASFWPQVVSDVAGIEQHVPDQTIGASYGDALLAAIGTGLVAPTTDWTRSSRIVAPRGELNSMYDERYALYRRLYDDTATIVHRLVDPSQTTARATHQLSHDVI